MARDRGVLTRLPLGENVRRTVTQFLLALATHRPTIEDFSVDSVRGVTFLEDAARRIFGAERNVWVVRPRGGEMDSVVDDAYIGFRHGAPFEATRLAAVLRSLTALADEFALFYGNDCDALPFEDDVLGVVENELADPHGAPEIYVRWAAPRARPERACGS